MSTLFIVYDFIAIYVQRTNLNSVMSAYREPADTVHEHY
jgi:hypothetical protein